MSSLRAALWSETLKARRSRVPWVSAAAFGIVPFIGGLFMVILKDPERARRLGIISTKAQMVVGTADWPTFLGMLAQATAVGGIFVFSLVASWVFGRESSDRTLKDLLALPTSRSSIVSAKFIVIGGWSALLTLLIAVLGLVVGNFVGMPGWSWEVLGDGLVRLALTAVMTVALVTPIAYAACAGGGYLPALGATILAVVFAQIIAATGWGMYFPWSIPALYSRIPGTPGDPIEVVSMLILAATSLAGMAATYAWWERADHTR